MAMGISDAMGNKDPIKRGILEGGIIIYPTDTIYGIGCDAANEKAVSRVRDMKERFSKPLSVIAPDKEWINENFIIQGKEEYLDKIPGPYTLVMEMKSRIVPHNVTPTMKLGVRMINNELQQLFEYIGVPIITTSLNITGMPNIKELSELEKGKNIIFKTADIIIDGGRLDGNPSTVIDITGDRPVYYRM
jgi:L-threonylcarbamoyladenylate synthase